MEQEQHHPQEQVAAQGIHAQAGNGQGAANPRPVHQPRNPRAIGAHDEPTIHNNLTGIRAPPGANNNF